jgi:hypothetical protein
MIRTEDDRQLTFILPFGGRLKPANRWIKLSSVVPWGDLESAYNAVMNMKQGRPSKPARLVIGAMIIKHKLNLSDEETVLQIQENPYLQYFCGYDTYIDTLPFVPSLFVEIRKRMGADMFACFEQGIVDQAVSIQQDKQSAAKSDDDDANPPTPPASDDTATEVISEPESNEVTHHGRLLMDATVADQMIRFPTDVSLLNQAREIAETLIDELHQHKEITGKKPRTYRRQARRAYLGISKRKRPGSKLIRKGIRQQLQYLRRNFKYIKQMLDTLMPDPGMTFPLKRKLQRQYWIIQQLYAQQQQMYKSKTRRCDDRIISISQPHVRPIVRGKAGKAVEFGSKISVSMVDKLAFVDRLSWDAFNESADLIAQVEAYKKRFGFYPEAVHADGIYGTRDNRKWLKDHGIRFAGKALGRPKKATADNKEEISQIKRQQRQDERLRIPVEGKFGQGKNGYRLNQIRARLASTSEAWVRSIFLVMNLIALLRFLLPARQIAGVYAIFEWVKVYLDCFRASLRHLNPFIMSKHCW